MHDLLVESPGARTRAHGGYVFPFRYSFQENNRNIEKKKRKKKKIKIYKEKWKISLCLPQVVSCLKKLASVSEGALPPSGSGPVCGLGTPGGLERECSSGMDCGWTPSSM